MRSAGSGGSGWDGGGRARLGSRLGGGLLAAREAERGGQREAERKTQHGGTGEGTGAHGLVHATLLDRAPALIKRVSGGGPRSSLRAAVRPWFTVGALALAGRRANAVGAVRITLMPDEIEVELVRVAGFSLGFAPGGVAEPVGFRAPLTAVRGLVREGRVLNLAFDPAVVTPYNRFALAGFSEDPAESLARTLEARDRAAPGQLRPASAARRARGRAPAFEPWSRASSGAPRWACSRR